MCHFINNKSIVQWLNKYIDTFKTIKHVLANSIENKYETLSIRKKLFFFLYVQKII